MEDPDCRTAAQGVSRWHGDKDARRAVYNNRARLRSAVGKQAMRQRAELVERSFAHILDRGGLRRTWLRGRENVHKRYLIHVAGHNLGLLMRLLIGAGTPKEAVARGWCFLILLPTSDGALRGHLMVLLAHSAIPALIISNTKSLRGDSVGSGGFEAGLIQGGERGRFAMPVPLRTDFDAAALRAIARTTKDGPQARRLLALAAIYEGATRTAAARIGGVTVQIVRDWVVKFNAHGPEGLVNRKPPGQPSKLTDAHRAALQAIIEQGPIPAIHGVVRWRLVDLIAWVWEEFRITISKQTCRVSCGP